MIPQHIYAFAAILAALLLSFVFFFLIPAFIVSRQLSAACRKLEVLNGKPGPDMEQIFRNRGVLEHLWLEYADSLHEQHDGQSVRLRSTLPAGAVFRPDILVDIPLRTDFFKHLPGIFTGVGIIGTFYGLLTGMKSFSVSNNSVVVRDSLTRLLHGVSEAFLISASAISLAMIVTFAEKLAVARLYAQSEKLAQLLDGLFEGGAGEEYLARLVESSESLPVQIADLFRIELKRTLFELHEKQTASAAANSDELAARIEAALKEPLATIAEALKRPESGMEALLIELGGQMRLHGELQRGTAEAVKTAAARMESVAANQQDVADRIAKAGEDAASREARVQDKLVALMERYGLQAPGDAAQEMRSAAGGIAKAFESAAERMDRAANGIAKAGEHVGTLLEKSSAASDSLATASSSLAEMFGDYKAERAALAGQVEALRTLSEMVMRDASMSGEVLERMEAATARLTSAQKDVDVYLSRVSDVIGAAHQSFSEGMSRAVGEANREFHQALTDSVRLLREGIQELESTLDAALSQPHAE